MRTFAHRKCLVLNKNWTAVGVVTLPRAIVMLFSTDAHGAPKAEIVDHEVIGHSDDGSPQYSFQPYTWQQWAELRPKDDEAAIHGCRGTFRIPEVIKLNRYDKLPIQKIHFSRRTIYKRDALTCQYCHKKFPSEELTIDHIVPRSEGGKTTWENCLLACVGCNKAKADRMPKRSGHTFTVFFQSGRKQWQVQVQEPKKPKYNFFRGDIHYESWKQWLDVAYWNIELDNQNED